MKLAPASLGRDRRVPAGYNPTDLVLVTSSTYL